MKTWISFFFVMGLCLFTNTLQAQIELEEIEDDTCRRCDNGICGNALIPNGLSSKNSSLTDNLLPKIKPVNSSSSLVKIRPYTPFRSQASIFNDLQTLDSTMTSDGEDCLRCDIGICDSAINGRSDDCLTDEILLNTTSVKSSLTPNNVEPYIPLQKQALEVNIYPNPFHLNTTIKYELAKDTEVLIEVYDSHYRKVKTLFSDYQTEGIQEVNFQGLNLEKGTYFCRIYIEDVQKTYPIIKL